MTRATRYGWTALLLLGLTPLAANAQTCRGNTPITSTSPVLVGGLTEFAEQSTYLAGTVGGGGNGAFALLDVGSIIVDAGQLGDDSSFLVDVAAGGQYRPGRVELCPTFIVTNEWVGDLFGSGVNGWQLTLGGGGSLGVVAVSTPTLRVVPTFSIFGHRARARFELAGDTAVVNDTYASIFAGVGLEMHRRFTITPALIRRTGFDIEARNGTTFRVTLTVGFPR